MFLPSHPFLDGGDSYFFCFIITYFILILFYCELYLNFRNLLTTVTWASLVTQLVKNPPAMWETWVRFLVGKFPWRRECLPTPEFWHGEFHGLYIVHGIAKSWTQLSDFHSLTRWQTLGLCFRIILGEFLNLKKNLNRNR